jgi:hypothetical protein
MHGPLNVKIFLFFKFLITLTKCNYVTVHLSHTLLTAKCPTRMWIRFQNTEGNEFYILLTLHLDVILVNDQLDAVFPLDRHVRQSPTRVCYTR